MKPIPNFPEYFATDDGHVWSEKSGKRLAEKVNHNGYPSVTLYVDRKQRTCPVHQLIAAAYIGPRPTGNDVNHIDHNKRNNTPQNLEYVTRQENVSAFRKHHGLDIGPPRPKIRGPRRTEKKYGKAVIATPRVGGVSVTFSNVSEAVAFGFTAAGVSQSCSGKIKFHRGYSFKKA